MSNQELSLADIMKEASQAAEDAHSYYTISNNKPSICMAVDDALGVVKNFRETAGEGTTLQAAQKSVWELMDVINEAGDKASWFAACAFQYAAIATENAILSSWFAGRPDRTSRDLRSGSHKQQAGTNKDLAREHAEGAKREAGD